MTTKLTQAEAVKLYEEELSDELDGRLLSKLAKKIRNEVLNESWKLEGDFSTYRMSPILLTFMKWILLGPTTDFDINTNRTLVVENLIKTPTQFISQNIKSLAKVSITLRLTARPYIQRFTRSKELINFLSGLNVGVNYHKTTNIKKSIVDAVLAKGTENNRVFIPSTINKENSAIFSINNVDLTIDTPNGKRQLHGTATVVSQQRAIKKVSFVTVFK